MAAPETTDELPELETAALEELSAEAMAPVSGGPSASNPFGDLSALPETPILEEQAALPAVVTEQVAAPVAAAPAASSQISAKDLTDDILGGVDFDVPVQGAPGAPKATPTMAPPKPSDAKPAAPFAFKPATPAFASTPAKPGSPFGTSAAAVKPMMPAAVAQPPKPAPAPGQQDSKSLFGDIGNDLGDLSALSGDDATPRAPARSSADILREALTADTAPAQLPPDALKLAFSLCRLLIKKGVISVDELV